MKRFLLIILLTAGCSGNNTIPTVQTVQTKTEKKTYKPSELVAMQTLPSGVIKIEGKVKAKDTNPNADGSLWVEVEDRGSRTEDDDKSISIRFSPGKRGFSMGLLKWFSEARQGWVISLEASVERLENDSERKVYGDGKQIN